MKKIFGVSKVSYDMPGPQSLNAVEQECLFLNVTMADNSFKDGIANAMVTGTGLIRGRAEKLPFGFYSKAIQKADYSLTKDLFFSDIEGNKLIIKDIIERGFSFTYFYSGQYDPPAGTIDGIDVTVEESDS